MIKIWVLLLLFTHPRDGITSKTLLMESRKVCQQWQKLMFIDRETLVLAKCLRVSVPSRVETGPIIQ